MDVTIFLIFAIIAVLAAINVVVQTHPIASAEFIAAAQVIVYAGAVMVLFVFVIMLLNAGAEARRGRSFMASLLGAPVLIALLALLAWFVERIYPESMGVHFGGFTGGSPQAIGRALFTTYLLPFEITSILVLIAILGAVVLALKEMD
jgi:NADH-quinone oxidoreductase subunit J